MTPQEQRQPQEVTMSIFRIDTGITHWVAAPGIIQALEAFAEFARSECLETHNAEESIDVSSVPESEARLLMFLDDGVGAKRSCWDMAQECESPVVFAGSEWP